MIQWLTEWRIQTADSLANNVHMLKMSHAKLRPNSCQLVAGKATEAIQGRKTYTLRSSYTWRHSLKPFWATWLVTVNMHIKLRWAGNGMVLGQQLHFHNIPETLQNPHSVLAVFHPPPSTKPEVVSANLKQFDFHAATSQAPVDLRVYNSDAEDSIMPPACQTKLILWPGSKAPLAISCYSSKGSGSVARWEPTGLCFAFTRKVHYQSGEDIMVILCHHPHGLGLRGDGREKVWMGSWWSSESTQSCTQRRWWDDTKK